MRPGECDWLVGVEVVDGEVRMERKYLGMDCARM